MMPLLSPRAVNEGAMITDTPADLSREALLTFLWVVIMRLPGLGGVGRGRRG